MFYICITWRTCDFFRLAHYFVVAISIFSISTFFSILSYFFPSFSHSLSIFPFFFALSLHFLFVPFVPICNLIIGKRNYCKRANVKYPKTINERTFGMRLTAIKLKIKWKITTKLEKRLHIRIHSFIRCQCGIQIHAKFSYNS